jgi:hypothetical protein
VHHWRNVSGGGILDHVDCVTGAARTASYSVVAIAAYAINFFDAINCRLAAYEFSHCQPSCSMLRLLIDDSGTNVFSVRLDSLYLGSMPESSDRFSA